MIGTHRAVFVLKIAAALVLAAACVAQAQKPDSGPAPKVGTPEKLAPHDGKAPKEKDEFRIKNADRVRYDTNRGLFYLYGNVEFQDKEVTVCCDEASYNEKDDTAACAGSLKMTDPDNVITGELVNADFNAEIINIVGSVKIVTTKTGKKEEKDAQGKAEDEKRVTTITCDKIQYYYTEGKRHAVATGNLKALQKDRTIFAQRADYDREKDVVVLGSQVTIKMENGNDFDCAKATISVTEDWVEMEGFKGKAVREKKDKKPGEAPKPAGEAPKAGG
jgi:lipopolysaccharide export system protein LptA